MLSVVGPEEARHPLPLLVRQAQRRHPVQAHAHAGVPHDHVRDAHRPLHERAELVALAHVLPPAGFRAATAVALAGEGLVDRRDLVVGVGPRS